MNFPVICPICSDEGDLRMFSNKGMLIWHIKSKHVKKIKNDLGAEK